MSKSNKKKHRQFRTVTRKAENLPQTSHQLLVPAPANGIATTLDPVCPSACDLAFWTQCQARVVGYITTNGTIQVAICGWFATAAGILVTQADPTKNLAQFQKIYQFVLPLLCFITLILSTNVYSWIFIQLNYIRQVGINPDRLTICPTYDAYKQLIASEWFRISRWRRIAISVVHAKREFLTLPLNYRDIYCYYCILYIVSGILSLCYGFGGFHWWFPIPYFLAFAFGTHDIRRLSRVLQHLPKHFTKP